jgi:hypothetical protein
MRARAYVAMIAASLASSSALAATLSSFKVGNWSVGAYSFDTGGHFSHCAALAPYNSGVFVVFSVTRDRQWAMSLASPQWDMQIGSVFDVGFTIDDSPPIYEKATVITKDQFKVQLLATSELFQRFMKGHELKVASISRLLTFNLTSTAQVLPALVRCVDQQINPAPAPVGTVAPVQQPKTNPRRAEAVTMAANVLAAAGITGFQILEETSEIKGDVVWMDGRTLGSLSIFPNLNPEAASASLIGAEAASCAGKFASGHTAEPGLRRVFAACTTSGAETVVYYHVTRRKAGGCYVFGTTALSGIDGNGPAKQADEQLRAAVLKIVR